MSNSYFRFKQFTINQERSAFKVGTDGVLLGASADISGAKRILDIGTGTGLIALMLAQRGYAEIVAIEPDHNSFVRAVENIKACPWSERIKVLEIRLQDYIPEYQQFDLIVSNPPYFIDSLKNPDPDVAAARHNTDLSQNDLLEAVVSLLNAGGKFEVILPYTEGNKLIDAAKDYGLFCNSILKIKPVPSSEIRRLILSFTRQKMPVTERFLTIENGTRHDFTQEYIDLTKDFYLKF